VVVVGKLAVLVEAVAHTLVPALVVVGKYELVDARHI